MSEASNVPLETDAYFNQLGPQGEKALDLIVGLMPHFGAGHDVLLRRRMLFNLLVLCLGPEDFLRQILTNPDSQSHWSKVLYFLGLYKRAAKEGIDDIEKLCDLVGEDNDDLYAFYLSKVGKVRR